jgi:hypothetical protein
MGKMNPAARVVSELKNVASVVGIGLTAAYASFAGSTPAAVLASRSLGVVVSSFRDGWFDASVFGVAVQEPRASIGLVREIYGRNPTYSPLSSRLAPATLS